MTRRGMLIAIEGIDGAGKTTQAHMLEQALEEIGHRVLYTKEPTTGTWGQLIRQSKVDGRLDPREEYQAFINDRREHVEHTLEPELEQGTIVIVDRYYFSTIAYQGAIGVKQWDEIQRENERFAPTPDLLIILELDPGTAVERIVERDDRPDSFETVENLRACREIFDKLEGGYILRLDATDTIQGLHDKIWSRVEQMLGFQSACLKPYVRSEVECGGPMCVLAGDCDWSKQHGWGRINTLMPAE